MKQAFGLLVVALLATLTIEPSFAQGNVGGTIGKKDKVVTGGDVPANKPARKTRGPAAPGANGCRDFVGTWTWYFGFDAVFSTDGTVRHTINTGKWSCTGGNIAIVWNNIGVTDRGTFSDDGATLSIVNSRGERFIGTRK